MFPVSKHVTMLPGRRLCYRFLLVPARYCRSILVMWNWSVWQRKYNTTLKQDSLNIVTLKCKLSLCKREIQTEWHRPSQPPYNKYRNLGLPFYGNNRGPWRMRYIASLQTSLYVKNRQHGYSHSWHERSTRSDQAMAC